MLEETLAKVVELANRAGLGPLYVLALLVAAAVVVVGLKALGRLPRDPPPPPEQGSEWNTDPANGAVVTPGPPGGTDDQNQAG